MWILLFQYAIHRDARFNQYNSSTCRGHLPGIYCLSSGFEFGYRPRDIFVIVGCYLRSAGGDFHPTTEMGDGWISHYLYPRYSRLLFRSPIACILEYGQILMVYTSLYSTDIRGSTRVAQGEGGKTVIISDEGRFDPRSIPKRKWEEYQTEMIVRNGNNDAQSQVSGVTRQSMRTSMFVPTADQRGRFSRVMDQQNFYDNPPPRIDPSPGRSPLARESYVDDLNVTLPQKLGGDMLEMQEAPIHPAQRASRAMSQVVGHERAGSLTGNIPGLPSDEQLLVEIRRMLESADLMSVTKKDVKLYLERVFGVPLDVRREYINQCTEAVLSGRL
jgi:chitin synthase